MYQDHWENEEHCRGLLDSLERHHQEVSSEFGQLSELTNLLIELEACLADVEVTIFPVLSSLNKAQISCPSVTTP